MRNSESNPNGSWYSLEEKLSEDSDVKGGRLFPQTFLQMLKKLRGLAITQLLQVEQLLNATFLGLYQTFQEGIPDVIITCN